MKSKLGKPNAIRMGSVAWKQLLLNALESNNHLKHSSYMQLVYASFSHSSSSFVIYFIFLAFIVFFVFWDRPPLEPMENLRIALSFSGSDLLFLLSLSHTRNFVLWKFMIWVVLGFRGFLDNTDNIQINTDTRTRKVLPFEFKF